MVVFLVSRIEGGEILSILFGSELNVHYSFVNIDAKLDKDKIYKSLEDNLISFNEDRETFPMDLELDSKINVNTVGDFFENGGWIELESENYLIVGHFYISSSASYEIDKSLRTINKKNFFEWAVYDYPLDNEGNNLLDCLSTGKSIAEESFIFIKRGREIHAFRESLIAPLDIDDELFEEQEIALESLSKSAIIALST